MRIQEGGKVIIKKQNKKPEMFRSGPCLLAQRRYHLSVSLDLSFIFSIKKTFSEKYVWGRLNERCNNGFRIT